MKPGQSISDTIGMPKVSHNCRKRAALSAAAAVMAPAITMVLLATMPTGRPSIRASAVTISRANCSRSTVTDPASASVSMTGTIG